MNFNGIAGFIWSVADLLRNGYKIVGTALEGPGMDLGEISSKANDAQRSAIRVTEVQGSRKTFTRAVSPQ